MFKFYITLFMLCILSLEVSSASSEQAIDEDIYTTSFNKSVILGNFDKAYKLLLKFPNKINLNKKQTQSDDSVISNLVKQFPKLYKDKKAEAHWDTLFQHIISKNLISDSISSGGLMNIAARDLDDDHLLQLLKHLPETPLTSINEKKRNAYLYMGMTKKVKALTYIFDKNVPLSGFENKDYVGHNLLFYMLDKDFSDELILNAINHYPKLVNMMSLINDKNLALSPLHIAAKKGRSVVLSKMLTLPDFDINQKGAKGKGKSALLLASEFSNAKTVKLILNAKGFAYATDEKGLNSLMLAIKNKKEEIAKFLIEEVSNLKLMKDKEGNSAIHFALIHGDVATIKELLQEMDFKDTNYHKENIFVLAAKLGNLEVIKLFLNEGFDLNSKDRNGITASFYIAQNFDKDIVNKFNSRAKSKNDYLLIRDSEGNSIIHHLAKKGALRAMDQLLQDNPIMLNIQNNKGRTPLQIALANKHLELAQFLINQENINLSLIDKNGRSAAYDSVLTDNFDILNLLLEKTNNDFFIAKEKTGPLMLAAYKGNLNAVKFLLDNPLTNINQTEPNSHNSALYFAVAKNHSQVVELLLNATPPANPFMPNKLGLTPAETAILSGNEELIQRLYEGHEEELNEALFFTLEAEGSIDIFNLLISLGADVKTISNRGNATGFDLLNYAAENEQEDIIDLLANDYKLDINKVGPSGQTPLMRVVNKVNSTLVEKILNVKNVDPNFTLKTRTGITITNPLLLSFETEDSDIINLLLETEGIDVNAIDLLGDTPLIIAINNDYIDEAAIMIHKGADISIINEDGENALGLSLKKGFIDLVEMMVLMGNKLDKEQLKSALKGPFAKDIDYMKSLIKLGADVNTFKELLRSRRTSFNKWELYQWMDKYLIDCRHDHRIIHSQERSRGPAAVKNTLYRLSSTSCMELNKWKLVLPGSPLKPLRKAKKASEQFEPSHNNSIGK